MIILQNDAQKAEKDTMILTVLFLSRLTAYFEEDKPADESVDAPSTVIQSMCCRSTKMFS